MPIKYLNTLLLVIIGFTLYSCDRSRCETNNEILLNHDVLSKTYQTEVAKQIEKIGIENLRFWLADYLEKDTTTYLLFYTQGTDLCAQILIQIDKTNPNLSGLVKTKGKGRFNAEFIDLKFDVTTNTMDQIEFKYIGHGTIID